MSGFYACCEAKAGVRRFGHSQLLYSHFPLIKRWGKAIGVWRSIHLRGKVDYPTGSRMVLKCF